MTTSKVIREKIWTRLHDVARPDTRFHLNFAEVIPDFEGSEEATARLVADPAYAATLPGAEAAAGQGLARRMVQVLKTQARARGVQRTALVSVQGSRLYWERQGYVVESVTNAAQQQHLDSYGEGALYMVGFI